MGKVKVLLALASVGYLGALFLGTEDNAKKAEECINNNTKGKLKDGLHSVLNTCKKINSKLVEDLNQIGE